jgi:hypothetical protein
MLASPTRPAAASRGRAAVFLSQSHEESNGMPGTVSAARRRCWSRTGPLAGDGEAALRWGRHGTDGIGISVHDPGASGSPVSHSDGPGAGGLQLESLAEPGTGSRLTPTSE